MTDTAPNITVAPARPLTPRGREPTGHEPWAGLVVVLGGLLMIAMDVAIVNVAAPRVRADLSLSDPALVLVVSGYTVAYAVLLITGARLGDDHGHRRLFLVGTTGFTFASLVCGLAPTAAVLVAARVLQGASGAMMGPQVLSIIQTQFRGESRRRAVPLYATVLAAGTVLGQVVGGLLVTADLFHAGWRLVFLVNVPVGIALGIAGRRYLGDSRGVAPRRTDAAGVAYVSAGVLGVVAAITFGPPEHWPAWTFASLVAGLGALCCATLHLRRCAATGRDPLVHPGIFDSVRVRRGVVLLLLMQVAYGGFLFAFTLHLQDGLAYSPLRSGVTFAPFAAAFAATSLAHRRIPSRFERSLMPVVLAALGIGYTCIALVARSGGWPSVAGAIALVIAGGAYGACFSATVARTIAGTPRRFAADASGLVGTVVQIGFVTGVASLGAWFVEHQGHTRHLSAHAFTTATVAAGALVLAAAIVTARGATRRTAADDPTEDPGADVEGERP